MMGVIERIVAYCAIRRKLQTLILFIGCSLLFFAICHFPKKTKLSSKNQGNEEAKLEPSLITTKTLRPTPSSKQFWTPSSKQFWTPPSKQFRPSRFKLTLPFIEPKLASGEKELYLAVMVNSGANGEAHRTLRTTIRKTWGNVSESLGNKNALKWKLFFAFGVAVEQADFVASLAEAWTYNDVIIGNFSETYRHVVIKTFMSLFWTETVLSCKFVLKTDDDVYVRVPPLMTWLNESGSPKAFYGGYVSKFHKVPRDPKSKWYITLKQYNKPKWPPWCQGAYTVFSNDVIPRYLIYTFRREPFHADDAYLGVASEDLQIKAVHIPRFYIEHKHPKRVRSNKELNDTFTIGHKVTPERMIGYHKYYQRIG